MRRADLGVAVMGQQGAGFADDLAAPERPGKHEAVGLGGDQAGDFGEARGGCRVRPRGAQPGQAAAAGRSTQKSAPPSPLPSAARPRPGCTPPRPWLRRTGRNRSAACRRHGRDRRPPPAASRSAAPGPGRAAPHRTAAAARRATASNAGRARCRRRRSPAASPWPGPSSAERRTPNNCASSQTRFRSSSTKRDAIGFCGSKRSNAARLAKPSVSRPTAGQKPSRSSRSSTIAPAIFVAMDQRDQHHVLAGPPGVAAGKPGDTGVARTPGRQVRRHHADRKMRQISRQVAARRAEIGLLQGFGAGHASSLAAPCYGAIGFEEGGMAERISLPASAVAASAAGGPARGLAPVGGAAGAGQGRRAAHRFRRPRDRRRVRRRHRPRRSGAGVRGGVHRPRRGARPAAARHRRPPRRRAATRRRLVAHRQRPLAAR